MAYGVAKPSGASTTAEFLVAGTAIPMRGQTISSGSITSSAIDVSYYGKVTIYFMANQGGTLEIDVLAPSGSWRAVDTPSVTANTLLVYTPTWNATTIRIVFTPSAYPATISEAYVVLRP